MKTEVPGNRSSLNLSVRSEPKNGLNIDNVDRYINNRIINRSKQLRYWRLNWRSGLIRLLERLLIGVNISDRLGGDFSQFANSTEFSSQIIESELLNKATVLKTLAIRPLGAPESIELPGVANDRKIIRFSQVHVDSYTGLIRTDSGFVVDSVLAHPHKLIFMGGLSDAYASSKGKVEELKGTWAVLPHSEYFYHTLIEEIGSLLAIREFDPNFKVVVFQDAPQWALDLLTEFGFEYAISSSRGLRIENLICATGAGTFSSIDFKRFSNLTKNRKPSKTPNIFLSRGKLSRGDEVQEKLILSQPIFADFQKIIPEEYSIKEQIAFFQGASKVASFHGGALSHLVWCKKGTKVLEIFNHPYRLYDFARIAHEGKLNYCAVDTVNQELNPKLIRKFLID